VEALAGDVASLTVTLGVDTTGDGRDDTTMTVPQAIEHQAQRIITRVVHAEQQQQHCSAEDGGQFTPESIAVGACLKRNSAVLTTTTTTANQFKIADLARALERMGECEERAQQQQVQQGQGQRRSEVAEDVADDVEMLDDIDILLNGTLLA
jgi:hypothetical protein